MINDKLETFTWQMPRFSSVASVWNQFVMAIFKDKNFAKQVSKKLHQRRTEDPYSINTTT